MFKWILVCLCCLCGCADQRAVQNAPPAPPVTIAEPLPSLGKDDVAAIVHEEVQTSSNTIQQNTQSLLGVSLGKLAEKVDAALLRLEANFNTKVDAQTNATATLVAEIRSDIKAEFNLAAKIDAQAIAMVDMEARINAKVDAKLDAMAAAQVAGIAGFNNKLNESVQKFSAGRDVTNGVTSSDIADIMDRAFISLVKIVSIIMGAFVSILGGGAWWVTQRRHKELLGIMAVPNGIAKVR